MLATVNIVLNQNEQICGKCGVEELWRSLGDIP